MLEVSSEDLEKKQPSVKTPRILKYGSSGKVKYFDIHYSKNKLRPYGITELNLNHPVTHGRVFMATFLPGYILYRNKSM